MLINEQISNKYRLKINEVFSDTERCSLPILISGLVYILHLTKKYTLDWYWSMCYSKGKISNCDFYTGYWKNRYK